MPVFKLCLKIFKSTLPSLVIYIGVFMGITFLFATQSTKTTESTFNQTRIPMVLISEDHSVLLDGFRSQLEGYATFLDMGTDPEALQEAFYYRKAQYILRIPAGFTDSLLKGEPLQLSKSSLPDSMQGVYIDQVVDQYFNLARLYLKADPDISQQELVAKLDTDMGKQTAVTLQTSEKNTSSHEFARNYFNYLAYSLFAVLVLGISTVILVFNQSDLKRRNACSPVSSLRMNLEFLGAHLSFTLAAWLLMMVAYLALHGKSDLSTNTLYFMINSLLFAFCGFSISFFIGSLVKNQSALSAITNVITLGPCFISGIFVPQELLGDTVLRIGSFTPTYWFARANNLIAGLTAFDAASLKPVFSSMLVELAFTAVFVSLALVNSKRQRLQA